MTAHPVYGQGTAAMVYIGDLVGRTVDDPVGEVYAITPDRAEIHMRTPGRGDPVYVWFDPANLALIRRGQA